ncbi:MAG: Uncharacterized protein CEO22_19 [Candidatus Berkelbacteria bacterium Gr01-1014_85]|uniref:Peptidase C39-like domain-containing protein n=1 Tax=Candidatus Berkelbacteria bacterium Gr01-1014_85 TaxID=2017150 RepID=A0A554JDZ6_9BACT|nr:MAG: Uncharacterized protein CEO22_19 [Candidatus Berkelbacteria bacterium Gr01-1014_85]
MANNSSARAVRLFILFGLIGLSLVGYRIERNYQRDQAIAELNRVSQSPSPTASTDISPALSPTASLAESPLSSAATTTPTPNTTVTPTPTPTPVQSSSPNQLSLAVPFTVQAPGGSWVEPYKEGCEEAVIIMIEAYLRGNRAAELDGDTVKARIDRAVAWQQANFGGHYDLELERIAMLAEADFGLRARVVERATLADLKKEIQAGRPVIIPADGQALKNPFFQNPGPPYHVLVMIGYDDRQGEIITNENGTRRGANFRYSYSRLAEAWADYDIASQSATGPRNYLTLSLD